MTEGRGWDHIEIDTAKKNIYVLKLVYRVPAPDIFIVITDAKNIARHVLTQLIAHGAHPASDQIFLWVWAQAPAGKGETGTQLVRVFGHVEYNYHNDQLEFKPWQP